MALATYKEQLILEKDDRESLRIRAPDDREEEMHQGKDDKMLRKSGEVNEFSDCLFGRRKYNDVYIG